MTLHEDADAHAAESQLLALGEVISKAARSVSFQWPTVVEEDDLVQEIRLHLWERPGSLAKVFGMDELARYRAVIGIGHQLASAERDDYDQYKGSYRYSVGEVKDLLKRGVLTVRLYDGFHDATVDLQLSLDQMKLRKPTYAAAIVSRYVDEIFPQDAEKVRLSRALTALVDGMNRSNKRRFSERDDGPGTRRVISSAVARHISSVQYSGREDGYDDGADVDYDRPSGGGFR